MRRFICLLISFFIIPFLNLHQTVIAQEQLTLSGAVVDSLSQQPLVGATVYVEELQTGVASDEHGLYKVDLPGPGTYTFLVRYLNHVPLEKKLKIEANRIYDFVLLEKEYSLEDIVVEAGRDSLAASSRSTSIISHEELERSRGQVLADVLKDVPGVSTLNTGPTISKPVIRGLHSQRLILLNNGIQQEGQQWGGEHAPEIDPFMPDRVEVVRGAAGVEYGIGAIGGVIKVENDQIAKSRLLSGEYNFNGFTNNLQAASSLRLEGGIPKLGNLGWRTQVSYRKAGDSRTPNDVIRNSGFEEFDYSAQLNYEKGRTNHDLMYSFFGTTLGIYRGAHIGNTSDLMRVIERGRPLLDYDFSYEIDAPKQRVEHQIISYKLEHDFENAGVFEFQYGYQQNDRQEFDAHGPAGGGPSDGPAFDLTLFTHTVDLKYRHQPKNGFFGTIGFNGMRQGNVRSSSGFLIPNFRSYNGGVYAIEKWTNQVWTLEGGLRYDYHWRRVFLLENRVVQSEDFNFQNLTFVGGIIYQFDDQWSLSSNFGSAWRPPGVNEQYSDGVHHGTAQYELGDRNLGIERSYNIDLTLRNAGPRSFLQLSVYNNFIDEFIYLQPGTEPVLTIRGSFPLFRYRATDTIMRGFDAVYEYQLSSAIRLGTSLSIIRATNLDDDVPLIFMPADRASASVHFDLNDLGLFSGNYFEISGSYVAEQTRFPAGIDYTDPPAAYFLANMQLGTRLGSSRNAPKLSISLNNALNTTYREYLSRFRYFIDEPGRNLLMRLSIPFGSSQ
jgi:iron complex outermembrane receptor protein